MSCKGRIPTIIWYQTTVVFDIEVRKGTMYVGAYLLSSLSGPKDPKDWDSRPEARLLAVEIDGDCGVEGSG